METFEHLGFLVQFSEGTALSQAATFFANSDSDMPAAPVPVSQILDWMSHHITLSLEYSTERSAAKESSQQIDTDVTMTDANASQPRNSTPSTSPSYYRNTTFVEGFSKTSVIKHADDVKGHSMKVSVTNSFLSVLYYLIVMSYETQSFLHVKCIQIMQTNCLNKVVLFPRFHKMQKRMVLLHTFDHYLFCHT
jgi:TBCC domain-containing protein 1